MNKKGISTDKAPAAIGPYSQAVQVGDILYTSGQIPIDPKTGKLCTGDITEQTELVFSNLSAILDSLGKNLDDAFKVNIFLKNMSDFAKVNEIYSQKFKAPYPARATVEVAGLPLGCDIEIELIAKV